MRVLIVDDHQAFRDALITTLRLVNEIQVVGEASDGATACQAAQDLSPDVILLDMAMPGMSGLEAMRSIQQTCPDISVVMLTAYAEPALEREAVAAGVAGFLAKGCGLQEILDALEVAVSPTRSRDADWGT